MPRVLLIDDDRMTREFYAHGLRNLGGFDTLLAGDGESGIKMARAERPDLILLDIMLPSNDGFEVLSTLKKDPALHSIPVVILSNFTGPHQVKLAQRGGAVEVLRKSQTTPAALVDGIPTWIRPEGTGTQSVAKP